MFHLPNRFQSLGIQVLQNLNYMQVYAIFIDFIDMNINKVFIFSSVVFSLGSNWLAG